MRAHFDGWPLHSNMPVEMLPLTPTELLADEIPALTPSLVIAHSDGCERYCPGRVHAVFTVPAGWCCIGVAMLPVSHDVHICA